jgi:hypothetical protein
MNKFILLGVTTLTAFTLALAQPASAKGPGGGAGGAQGGWKASGGNPHGFSQGRKLGWGSAGHPPGWSHGRRTGWNGASVPPGWSRY